MGSPRRRPTAAPEGSPSRGRRPLPAFVGATAALAALAGVILAVGRPRGPTASPNVLLVTIDTLRADRLGCYGRSRAATPTLDALSARGVRFATAVAHAPLTTPSHASILTGLTPLRHGIRDNAGFALPESIPTLAEAFGGAGYRTAAFVSGFPLDRRFGLARGFDVYDDRLPRGDDPRRAAYVERPADRTTQAAMAWLDGGAGTAGPWFLWVHYFDPHAPYEPPAELASRFASDPYDGEIAFVDAQLAVLLHRIEKRRETGRTLVLVTADHGESLGQHGEETHGVFIYDATLKVPFLVAGPGVPAGAVSSTVARGVDVAPTVLDLAEQAPFAGDGRSLRPAVLGEAMPDAAAYVESLFARLQCGWAPLHGWRTAGHKLIEAPRPELYDLERDPAESKDRLAEEPHVAEALRRELRLALATPTPAASAALDPSTAERLRALGYLGGAPGAGRTPSRRDPKDGIALLRRLERGIAEARSNPELAAKELAAVLVEDPDLGLARRYRAIALAQMGDAASAVAEMKTLERSGALSVDDVLLLAECLRLLGRPDEALQEARRAADREPRSAEARLLQARLLLALGRSGEAAQAYESLLALVPDHPAALLGLGDLAMARNDAVAAAGFYSRVLERDPGDVSALTRLGATQARAGRLDEAAVSFRRALASDSRSPEALAGLGGVLARNGRPAEAVACFERALAAGARTPAILNGLGFARLESGDEAGSLAALRESLRLDPRQGEIAEVVSRLSRRRQAPRSRP